MIRQSFTIAVGILLAGGLYFLGAALLAPVAEFIRLMP